MVAKKKAALATTPKADLPIPAADLAELSGQGFEDADSQAFAIPFLRILQALSPQVDSTEAAYIDGANQGTFFNTITNQLYGDFIEVIPVHYSREFIEWAPNRGGFQKAHGSDPGILDRVVRVDDKNNQYLDNGNTIQDTRNHFVLIVSELHKGPVILNLSSSGIKHSRKWMSMMNALVIPGTETKAPMFAGVWEIKTTKNKNDDGTWYMIGDKNVTCVEFKRWVTKTELNAAQEARKLIKSGTAKVDWEAAKSEPTAKHEDPNTTKNEDDIPF